MDDSIFDEADAILSEMASDEDKSFNESELQDIMSEIEDLEKEFVAEAAPMSLQEQIDAEMGGALDEVASAEVKATPEKEIFVEAVTPVAATPKVAEVLPFEKVTPKSKTTTSEVSFAAHGQMALNLDFKIGEETATLSIDPVKGLTVTLSGVELCINEDSGCTLSMENGMKFTIPLSSPDKQDTSSKKKAV